MMAFLLGLAVTLAAPPANTLDSEAVIADLITKQRELAAIYDTLSYTATVESAEQHDFQDELFQSTRIYTVSHRGGTTLVNWVSSSAITEIEQRENGVKVDSKFEVDHTPVERRILLSDEVQVFWRDTNNTDEKSVQRPRRDGGGFPRDMAAYFSDVRPQTQCFGGSRPLFEQYEQRRDSVRWDVQSVPDSTDLLILRSIEMGPGDKKQDLSYQLGPDHGLLRVAAARPGGSTSDTAIRYSVWEHQGREIPVPEAIVTEVREEDGTLLFRQKVTFSNFHDESEQPAHTQESAGAMGSTLLVSAPVP